MANPRNTQSVGGAVGGLQKRDVVQVIWNLLEDRERPVRLVVRPEAVPKSVYYVVEWQYLRFDSGELVWKPV